jgi:hypothetical protein
MRLLRIFLTVIGAMLLFWSLVDYVPSLLQLSGREATGLVTGKSIERQGSAEEADGFFTLHYEFEANGSKHRGKASVSHSVYNRTEVGESIQVRYSHRDPATHLPAGYLGGSVRGLPLLIAGAVLFIVGFFFIKPAY